MEDNYKLKCKVRDQKELIDQLLAQARRRNKESERVDKEWGVQRAKELQLLEEAQHQNQSVFASAREALIIFKESEKCVATHQSDLKSLNERLVRAELEMAHGLSIS